MKLHLKENVLSERDFIGRIGDECFFISSLLNKAAKKCETCKQEINKMIEFIHELDEK